MATGDLVTKLDLRKTDHILTTFLPRADALVLKVAFDAQGRAGQHAPVEFGALKNSIYVVTKEYDGFQISRAKVLEDVRLIEIPRPADILTAHFGPSVEYGLYQEMGTKWHPAHPYMIPALKELKPSWKQAWGLLIGEYAR